MLIRVRASWVWADVPRVVEGYGWEDKPAMHRVDLPLHLHTHINTILVALAVLVTDVRVRSQSWSHKSL